MKIIERSNKSLSPILNSARSSVTAEVCERCVGRAWAVASEAAFGRSITGIEFDEMLLMLLVYGKNEQDDLTPEQLRTLKSVVEKEFK
jgi:hypothetical protein